MVPAHNMHHNQTVAMGICWHLINVERIHANCLVSDALHKVCIRLGNHQHFIHYEGKAKITVCSLYSIRGVVPMYDGKLHTPVCCVLYGSSLHNGSQGVDLSHILKF